MNLYSILKSDTESSHQKALFAYMAVAYRCGFDVAELWARGDKEAVSGYEADSVAIPALEWIHHVPNGGSRGDTAKARAIRGGRLKAEGVKKGIPDIFLPFPTNKKAGLYIEMKKPSQKPKTSRGNGGLSDEQLAFKQYAEANYYKWVVCYSWREAADVIREYIQHGVKI